MRTWQETILTLFPFTRKISPQIEHSFSNMNFHRKARERRKENNHLQGGFLVLPVIYKKDRAWNLD
jgi:hypothetical protein